MSKVPVIAIVDDDSAMREAICDLLLVVGFAPTGFASARDFLTEWTPHRFDLLVTDLRMPEMDGVALLQRLGELRADLPAIVVTSSSDPQSRACAIEAGALGCLIKPVPDIVLLQWIGRAMGMGWEPPPDL